jgi:hypothetical protein
LTNSSGTVPGIVWPDIPAAPDADLLGLLFQIEQAQLWPAERLRDAQPVQLCSLLRHAHSDVRFRCVRVDDPSRRALNAMRLVKSLVVRLSSVT